MDQNNRQIYAWALYDWGNSAYATAVMAGFFPIFFKQYYAHGIEAGESTFWLGLGNSAASIVILLLAPLLGTLSDIGGLKKRFLTLFALLGAGMTLALSYIELGQMHLAIACYALSAIGFSGANVFYDSLLTSVSREETYERTSSIGYSLGYLGGGIVFLFGVLMVQMPEIFGLEGPGEAIRLAFIVTAAWWVVFTVPLLLLVPESKRIEPIRQSLIAQSFSKLRSTFAKIRKIKTALLFLIAYWFYIDGVDTIAKMAVDFGLNIGLESSDLIMALLIIQFLAFPSTLLTYKYGMRIGPKRMILFLIGIYLCVTMYAGFMTSSTEFFILAMFIAFAQGGVQALSRALYARIIPREYSGEFFGFYNMFGKFAAIVGPLLVGFSAIYLSDPRFAILPVAILFLAGGGILWKIDIEKGTEEAKRYA